MVRAGSRARLALLVLACVLLLTHGVPAASAQVPVLVEPVTDTEATVMGSGNASFAFELVNLNPQKGFFVSVHVHGLDDWDAHPEPNRFVLGANASREVNVTLTPADEPAPMETGRVLFNLVDTETGSATRIGFNVTLHVQRDPLVLGLMENPLRAPLDNAYGVFLLDMAFWAGVGIIAFLAGDTIVRYLTRYARRDVTRTIVGQLRWPIFAFVVLLGVRASFGVLPRNAFTMFVDRFLTVIALGVVGIYLFYRVMEAFITYYAREVAPRTRTTLDDIVAPFLHKVNVVLAVLLAIGYFLRLVGVDLSVLFAGAGVMGIVIGLAAQESLSNFFGGLFILLDRPFTEGDDLQLETGEVVRVEHVGLRSTKLYNYRDHDMVILPNNTLVGGRVTNLSYPDPRFKLNLDVGVAYGSDVEQVKRALHEAVSNDPRIIHEPDDEPLTRFNAFGDNALQFAIRFGVYDYRDRWQIANDVRERIDAIFRREGINIPFPQRTLWLKETPRVQVESREGDADGRGA